jgi:Fe-S-cluster-containing dehydrogenase component/DMSO reductase anchor subunit
MRNGFIFNHDLCVACKACSAACMLENGWDLQARNIYSSATTLFLPAAVVNLSMACNHCSEPACKNGCPSGAYFEDEKSGAIIINPDLCLGCRYCLWNCPYDAPKFNDNKGLIEKCHYCHERQKEELEPACSSACPTGALSFGEIPERISHSEIKWMAETGQNPSLVINGGNPPAGVRIIPEPEASSGKLLSEPDDRLKMTEWSLVLFSFLSVISVSVNISGVFNEDYNRSYLPHITILAAVFISVFHLGNKKNLWRAIFNVQRSPLSREILMLLVYSAFLIASLLTRNIAVESSSAIAGLLFLISIDGVYWHSSGKKTAGLHSGQSFLTALLISSYLTDSTIPFLFIALLKLLIIIYHSLRSGYKNPFYPLRIFRASLLIILAAVIFSGMTRNNAAIIILIAGELIDRILFYIDFKPENIKHSIRKTN